MPVPITEPEVTKFSNEEVRPHSEKMFALHSLLTALKAQYDSVIGPILVPYASDDYVDDGREAEGINRLEKNDLALFQAEVDTMLTRLNTGGNLAVVHKPNVRGLQSIL